MTLSERLEQLRLTRIAVMENVRKIKDNSPKEILPGMCLVNERLLTNLITAAREVVE